MNVVQKVLSSIQPELSVFPLEVTVAHICMFLFFFFFG